MRATLSLNLNPRLNRSLHPNLSRSPRLKPRWSLPLKPLSQNQRLKPPLNLHLSKFLRLKAALPTSLKSPRNHRNPIGGNGNPSRSSRRENTVRRLNQGTMCAFSY